MADDAMPAPGSELSVIKRKDGAQQFAWRGRPLYRWEKDKEPGQVTGHNLGEVWFAARP
jgi:predicted lipoprotein with Yx(FWY)xxD motif